MGNTGRADGSSLVAASGQAAQATEAHGVEELQYMTEVGMNAKTAQHNEKAASAFMKGGDGITF